MNKPSYIKKDEYLPTAKFVDIHQIILLESAVYKVTLNFDECVPFLAGQYLKLWLNHNEYGSFSIGCNDYFEDKIDIYIGCNNNQFSLPSKLLKNMQLMKKIYLSLPFGDAYYRKSDNQNIFIIVSGTGYAYGKSILLQALQSAGCKKIHFLWICCDMQSLYELELLLELKQQYTNFDFSILPDKDDILNKNNIFIELLGQKQISSDSDIYLAGNPSIVRSLLVYFDVLGIKKYNIYGDFVKAQDRTPESNNLVESY